MKCITVYAYVGSYVKISSSVKYKQNETTAGLDGYQSNYSSCNKIKLKMNKSAHPVVNTIGMQMSVRAVETCLHSEYDPKKRQNLNWFLESVLFLFDYLFINRRSNLCNCSLEMTQMNRNIHRHHIRFLTGIEYKLLQCLSRRFFDK